jgi:SulP family sulfate permease
LLLVLLFIGKWAALIPMATLAAVLVVVAYNMSEWREFIHLLKSPRGDVAVLLATFLLTIFVELTVAIQVDLITSNLRDEDEFESRDISKIQIPPGVEVFEVYGSLFFGAVAQFRESIRVVSKKPKVIILRMRNVVSIDASGVHILEELAEEGRHEGYVLVFSAVSRSVYRVIRKSGFVETVGRQSFAGDIFGAIEIAKRHLDASREYNKPHHSQ